MSEPAEPVNPDSPAAYFNRELSWLRFAERVLALASDPDVPLFERVKFAGITGMLHDEFFTKRISGLKRRIDKGARSLSLDGKTPDQEFEACRVELARQSEVLGNALACDLRPALAAAGSAVRDYAQLDARERDDLREYFARAVEPILTPLAVDAEHPFPFISGLGLNLAVIVPDQRHGRDRFVRIKVPNNRPRWTPIPGDRGVVPLEQVIAANLDRMFPEAPPRATHLFRITRGAEGDREREGLVEEGGMEHPGSLVELVTHELKARRFAGGVRLEVDPQMPERLVAWLCRRLGVGVQDVYPTAPFLAPRDLLDLTLDDPAGRHSFCAHEPAVHPRLRALEDVPSAIFEEIDRGDLLLHHPYHAFDSSVLRFLESAATDPTVLAIKLTIYRTGVDSPIIRALVDASRRGKQVAVLVEITARFDEAPNIAWGKLLEQEGVHVSYGVERLKTHVKLALVVREVRGEVRRYAHVGTGNYNVRTARVYEDLGLLTADPEITTDVAAVFHALTSATPGNGYRRLIVAPHGMRRHFVDWIRREAEHAAAGRPSGIWVKLNQLQDQELIRELYMAAAAGVPITLVVRGLCCLRPGVAGLSETIRVCGIVGRFLEHSRVYRFENGGAPEYFIGSADWMKRNLDARVETIVPLDDPLVRRQIDRIVEIYAADNASVWDCGSDGVYIRRAPAPGAPHLAAQDLLAREAAAADCAAPTASRGQ